MSIPARTQARSLAMAGARGPSTETRMNGRESAQVRASSARVLWRPTVIGSRHLKSTTPCPFICVVEQPQPATAVPRVWSGSRSAGLAASNVRQVYPRIAAEGLPAFMLRGSQHVWRLVWRSCPRPNSKGIDAGCGKCRRSPQREALLRRCCPGHRNLRVLFGSHTRHADGTDNLPIDDDWHATL